MNIRKQDTLPLSLVGAAMFFALVGACLCGHLYSVEAKRQEPNYSIVERLLLGFSGIVGSSVTAAAGLAQIEERKEQVRSVAESPYFLESSSSLEIHNGTQESAFIPEYNESGELING